MKNDEVINGLSMTGQEIEELTKHLTESLALAHRDGEQLKAFIIRDALRMLGAIE
ncbi:MAG: hypothetical protein WC373_17515 [Smithella sp.]|jgi:hypothetical protein